MNPIQGEWLLNAGVADYARQCSGTMWEAAVHGGSQDLFLSASESISYDVKGIDPWIETPTPTADFGLDALGEFSSFDEMLQTILVDAKADGGFTDFPDKMVDFLK